MFDNILVAVDDTPDADGVIDVAADMAATIGAEVVVLHVRARPAPMARAPVTTQPETAAVAQGRPDAAAARLAVRPVPVTTSDR